eukprot:10467654-Lingulodinium_polyedra.AAC.1
MHHRTLFSVIGRGQMAIAITYSTKKFVEACVDAYKELAHVIYLKEASTAFLPEAAENSTAGRPAATGEVMECLWCLHAF